MTKTSGASILLRLYENDGHVVPYNLMCNLNSFSTMMYKVCSVQNLIKSGYAIYNVFDQKCTKLRIVNVFYFSDCTMTVHQNLCKDYIVECNKPKTSKVCLNAYYNIEEINIYWGIIPPLSTENSRIRHVFRLPHITTRNAKNACVFKYEFLQSHVIILLHNYH